MYVKINKFQMSPVVVILPFVIFLSLAMLFGKVREVPVCQKELPEAGNFVTVKYIESEKDKKETYFNDIFVCAHYSKVISVLLERGYIIHYTMTPSEINTIYYWNLVKHTSLEEGVKN